MKQSGPNYGIIDLRKGILKTHDPADLITKLAPVSYDADADMPLIKEWLLEIMDGSSDLVLCNRKSWRIVLRQAMNHDDLVHSPYSNLFDYRALVS